MKRAVTGVCIMLAIFAPSWAQSKKDPLTEKQIEEVREAGDDPPERLKLFVGYIDDRSTAIHTLGKESADQKKLHTLFDEFTRLSDDLEDNMDAFNEQHADLRKILKVIIDKSGEWTTVLNEPKPNTQYDFMRKTALESNQSVHDAASQMLPEQVKYFADKKKAEKEAEKKEEQTR
jgi:hypothetical protein